MTSANPSRFQRLQFLLACNSSATLFLNNLCKQVGFLSYLETLCTGWDARDGDGVEGCAENSDLITALINTALINMPEFPRSVSSDRVMCCLRYGNLPDSRRLDIEIIKQQSLATKCRPGNKRNCN
jgi:hypothetical protein